MKLKFRVVFLVGVTFVGVILLSHGLWSDPTFLAPHPRPPQQSVWTQGGAHRGHLNIRRKDLDLSNDTERSKSQKRLTDQSEQHKANDANDIAENEALEFLRNTLLKDKMFVNKKNLEKLLRVADIVKNTSVFHRQNPNKMVLTKEFLPDEIHNETNKVEGELDASLQLEILGGRSNEHQAKVENSALQVELKSSELALLKNVKSSRKFHFGSKRKGIQMDIYDQEEG